MSRPWIVFATLVVGAAVVAPAAGTPVTSPKHGGTIAVGYPSFAEPACLNPFTCTDVIDPALTQVLEGAFEFGPDLVPRPDLVSDVTPGRNPFSLTYHIRPEARWSDGVPVTARVYAPPPVFIGQILPAGDFDAALFSWGGAFGGTFVWPEALCGSEQNFAGYCSRLVTRDAEQNLIGSLAARARVLNPLDAKLADAVPVLPVVQPVARVFYRSNVRGIVLGGSPFAIHETSEDWWLAPER